MNLPPSAAPGGVAPGASNPEFVRHPAAHGVTCSYAVAHLPCGPAGHCGGWTATPFDADRSSTSDPPAVQLPYSMSLGARVARTCHTFALEDPKSSSPHFAGFEPPQRERIRFDVLGDYRAKGLGGNVAHGMSANLAATFDQREDRLLGCRLAMGAVLGFGQRSSRWPQLLRLRRRAGLWASRAGFRVDEPCHSQHSCFSLSVLR
jgi:hypothetical protein